LDRYILPQWGGHRINQIYPQAVEDWLHSSFGSWWAMHGARAIMSRIFYYAERHGLWEEGKRSPASRAKLGKKCHRYERRILSFEETARVLARLEEPYLLILETCIGIGGLVARYGARSTGEPDEFIFQQKRCPGKPLWDSGVRDALHQAAEAEGCDFAGLGPHSFRRANITWRQEVGGSAIEASKIAGHSDLHTTGHYTLVSAERQNELTRRIQDKLASATKRRRQTSSIMAAVAGQNRR
jgi:hypothetical protein